MVQSPQSWHKQCGMEPGRRRATIWGPQGARQQVEDHIQAIRRKVDIVWLRTDNSIKNHFYSTIRRCLRRINKLQGEKNSTLKMRSIKPYVLSKILADKSNNRPIQTWHRPSLSWAKSNPTNLGGITRSSISRSLIKWLLNSTPLTRSTRLSKITKNKYSKAKSKENLSLILMVLYQTKKMKIILMKILQKKVRKVVWKMWWNKSMKIKYQIENRGIVPKNKVQRKIFLWKRRILRESNHKKCNYRNSSW